MTVGCSRWVFTWYKSSLEPLTFLPNCLLWPYSVTWGGGCLNQPVSSCRHWLSLPTSSSPQVTTTVYTTQKTFSVPDLDQNKKNQPKKKREWELSHFDLELLSPVSSVNLSPRELQYEIQRDTVPKMWYFSYDGELLGVQAVKPTRSPQWPYAHWQTMWGIPLEIMLIKCE